MSYKGHVATCTAKKQKFHLVFALYEAGREVGESSVNR